MLIWPQQWLLDPEDTHLSKQRLLGQHREFCALRGKGWVRNKNQSTVSFIQDHPIEKLIALHMAYIVRMREEGYGLDSLWLHSKYRGKSIGVDENIDMDLAYKYYCQAVDGIILYPEEHIGNLQMYLDKVNG